MRPQSGAPRKQIALRPVSLLDVERARRKVREHSAARVAKKRRHGGWTGRRPLLGVRRDRIAAHLDLVAEKNRPRKRGPRARARRKKKRDLRGHGFVLEFERSH
eukprot:Amastigsp_a340121_174.p6 type:complete len:104 gc:universal Amastigsp_a340121_174:1000-1311(+)